MRLSAARSALLSIVLSTSACYQSPVPIAGPALPVDANLVGTWEEIDAEASPTIVKVTADSASSYRIEIPWNRKSTTDVLRARAVVSDVAGTTFVTLHEFDEPGFLVMKLRRESNGTIRVATLKESVPRFDSPEALRDYLAQHSNDASIIQDELHLRKVSSR